MPRCSPKPSLCARFWIGGPNPLPPPLITNVSLCNCLRIIHATPQPPSTSIHHCLARQTRNQAMAARILCLGLQPPSPASCSWMHHPMTAATSYAPPCDPALSPPIAVFNGAPKAARILCLGLQPPSPLPHVHECTTPLPLPPHTHHSVTPPYHPLSPFSTAHPLGLGFVFWT